MCASCVFKFFFKENKTKDGKIIFSIYDFYDRKKNTVYINISGMMVLFCILHHRMRERERVGKYSNPSDNFIFRKTLPIS